MMPAFFEDFLFPFGGGFGGDYFLGAKQDVPHRQPAHDRHGDQAQSDRHQRVVIQQCGVPGQHQRGIDAIGAHGTQRELVAGPEATAQRLIDDRETDRPERDADDHAAQPPGEQGDQKRLDPGLHGETQ